MVEILKRDPFKHYTKQTWMLNKRTIRYLTGKIKPNSTILDIGQASPLTELLGRVFRSCKIYNTAGDLDGDFIILTHPYDVVIYSHTIEHQFNPLNTLLKIKDHLTPNAKVFIFLPDRPKFLWTDGHYHEIDKYRMKLLLERAGYKIVSYEREKTRRPFFDYFNGIRPVLRFFLEHIATYEVVVND